MSKVFIKDKFCFICKGWNKNQRYDYRGNPIEEPTWGHKVELWHELYGLCASVKVGYYNRTWEKYEYQSAMYQALDKFEQKELKRFLRDYKFSIGLAEYDKGYNIIEKPFKKGQKAQGVEEFYKKNPMFKELKEFIEEGK